MSSSVRNLRGRALPVLNKRDRRRRQERVESGRIDEIPGEGARRRLARGRSRSRESLELPDEVGLVGVTAAGREVRPGGSGAAARQPENVLEPRDPRELLRRESDAGGERALELARAAADAPGDRGDRRAAARGEDQADRGGEPRVEGPARARFRRFSRNRSSAARRERRSRAFATSSSIEPASEPQTSRGVGKAPAKRSSGGSSPRAPPGRKRTPSVETGPVGAISIGRVVGPTRKLAG